MRGPSLKDIGSRDPVLIDAWQSIHDCVSRGGFEGAKPSCLVRAVYYEPNQLKIEMDKMLLEHKDAIRVMYHSWGARPIMEGNVIKGVAFESKEGRRAVLAKVVIDATGDGDIFRQTGAPYSSLADGECRSSTTALVWRIAGIDWDQFEAWKRRSPQAMAALRERLAAIAGFRCVPLPTNQNDMCWINNWHPNMDCSTVADQTKTEIETRDTIRDGLAFRADTLESLADQIGIDRDAFLNTVAQYNACCHAKDDRQFGKRAELLFPIEKGPFTAIKLGTALLEVVGGLSINTKMGFVKGEFTQVNSYLVYPQIFPQAVPIPIPEGPENPLVYSGQNRASAKPGANDPEKRDKTSPCPPMCR